MLDAATPGPWVVEAEWNVCGPNYAVVNGSTGVIDDDESAANARLIAAAPDLAAEVLRLRDQVAELKAAIVALSIHASAEAAIAALKAKLEGEG